MVLSDNHIEIFNNEIHDNQAVNLALVWYGLLDPNYHKKDPNLDGYVWAISIHDNALYGGGNRPAAPAPSQPSVDNGKLLKTLMGGLPIPDIVWTRLIRSDREDPNDPSVNKTGDKICIYNNTGTPSDPVKYT